MKLRLHVAFLLEYLINCTIWFSPSVLCIILTFQNILQLSKKNCKHFSACRVMSANLQKLQCMHYKKKKCVQRCRVLETIIVFIEKWPIKYPVI